MIYYHGARQKNTSSVIVGHRERRKNGNVPDVTMLTEYVSSKIRAATILRSVRKLILSRNLLDSLLLALLGTYWFLRVVEKMPVRHGTICI